MNYVLPKSNRGMKHRFIFILFLSSYLFIPNINAQADCECEDLEITLCYLPAGNYCDTNGPSLACGYALDGRHMNDYLRPKLINPGNFGVNGVVKCPIQLVPLSRDISVSYIEQQQCDIVFTGNFTLDTINLNVDTEVTSIPEYTLLQIKEWSEKCRTNLVITSQTEASWWGYEIQNRNENPNFSVGNQLGDFIFSGPFGDVETFNQGGSYQGIITEGPPSGYTSLGVDQNGLPTLVIDKKTNDIILGDIGIFCGGSTGSISFGSVVSNDNDRLAANIFALVCELASGAAPINEVFLCPGDEYVLPLGEVVNEDGIYVDSLISVNNCDSIVTTIIQFAEAKDVFLDYDGCTGDNYSVNVNGIIYDENNPTGEELLQSIFGCDSLVNIQLIYKANSEETYEDLICSHDLEGVLVGNTVFNAINPVGQVVLPAANGCDSIINVNLEVLPENKTIDAYQICRGGAITVKGKTYETPVEETFVYEAANGCDSVFVVSIDYYPEIPTLPISNPLQVKITENFHIVVNLAEDYTVEWSPEEIVSCTDCLDFYIEPDLNYEELFYTLTDTYGCSKTDTIVIEYECPIYIPNAFSPSSKNVDNQSFFIATPCLHLIGEYEMMIFDRWGSMVFKSEDPFEPWFGSSKTKEYAKGVYVYVMKYSSFNREKIVAGDVTMF